MMMGERQVDQSALFYEFSLEKHVPLDHMLRAIDRFVDLGDVRTHLAPFYSTTGRPSVDPELLIRMLIIGYCYGIRSERRLCEEVHLNLGYRWFCRFGLAGEVPDHSIFSKNRHGRFRDSKTNRAKQQTIKLYNNAFILRRRIPYQDGFPIGTPEIVFKFRHTDPQKTAEIDMRPHINGDYRIKFKAEALPLKDGLGGMRMLYSHNVEFHLESAIMSDRMSMERIAQALPALQSIPWEKDERAELVGGTIVEEVLQDIGVLDFGNRMSAMCNVALWRNRGDHAPLIGEFAFQLKFRRREELTDEALGRCEAFFLALQAEARDWIQLGATKTGVVYRLKGNPPHAHE